MIGILVVTHGQFAEAIVKSAELIIGEQTHYKTLGLIHGEDIEGFKEKVTNSIEKLNDGDGVLIFVDFYGGSPFNATAVSLNKLSEEINMECIIGVNFCMILETFLNREQLSLDELKEHCLSAGKESIKDLKEEFSLLD